LLDYLLALLPDEEYGDTKGEQVLEFGMVYIALLNPPRSGEAMLWMYSWMK